jgi:hypothetical protein
MKNILFITMALTVAVYAFGATKRIARVNEDGDTIFDRDGGFSPDVIEVEVSEIDGSIYVSMYQFNIGKFDENGFYDAGFDLPAMYLTRGFDINYADHLWISGVEVVGDYGLYEYDNTGDYVNGFEGFYPEDDYFDDSVYEVWTGGGAPLEPGVHKFTEDGTLLFYLPEYRPRDYIDGNSVEGSCWFPNGRYGKWELIKLNEDGSEAFRLNGVGKPDDPQVYPNEGSCWFTNGYTGDLYKVDAFGSIVFHDGTFSEIAAIDVNESDGSVWVASNVPKRLVHLDKDGNRELYMPWPGGDFAHLAVDQRNGTCIVIYEESKSGDLNIQPASVGEIKAMYAE